MNLLEEQVGQEEALVHLAEAEPHQQQMEDSAGAHFSVSESQLEPTQVPT